MRLFLVALLCSVVVHARPAAASGESELEDLNDDADDDLEDLSRAPEPWAPHIGAPRPFSVGLDAYGGLSLLFKEGDDRARAMTGGLLRLSYWYLQAGGTAETSNTGEATALRAPKEERWIAYGGFVGALVPYHRWIDVDATVGLVSRTYKNSSEIYGPDGFTETGPSITWRFGISARSGERKTFGARVGAGFWGAFDTVTHHPQWTREYLGPGGTLETVSGTTPIGGVSFGLYLSAGIEVSARR
jgi:hypothetical protein